MRFYDQQHQFYCGVDLHTKRMYLCILDGDGNKQLHRNVRAKPQDFLRAVEPFREDFIRGGTFPLSYVYPREMRATTPSHSRCAKTVPRWMR